MHIASVAVRDTLPLLFLSPSSARSSSSGHSDVQDASMLLEAGCLVVMVGNATLVLDRVQRCWQADRLGSLGNHCDANVCAMQ